MSTVIMKRGTNSDMNNTPRINGLIFFNTDDKCIYLDDGDNTHERTIYGGKISTISSIASNDGASDNNVYTALAVKNGTCLKSNVAETADNITNTNDNGRPVGCVGFKSIIGTTNISDIGNTVKGAISNLNNRLIINNNKFVFDYQGGKWGFNTSEGRGADTFHPFNSTVLTMYKTNTDGSTYDITNNDIIANNVYLQFQSYTDSSMTGLPANTTSGEGVAVVTQVGRKASSSSKYMMGGIIHLFSNDNHNHYIYLDKWYTEPTTDYTHYLMIASNSDTSLAMPFIRPSLYHYNNKYMRDDELYMYTCKATHQAQTTWKINFYEYTGNDSTSMVYTSQYEKSYWSSLYEIPFYIDENNNITQYKIGGHGRTVMYHDKLYLIGGSYQVDGQTYLDTNLYIYDFTNEIVTIPITHDFITHTIYATLVHNDKIYIFYYDDTAENGKKLKYITYDTNQWSISGYVYGSDISSSAIDYIDEQSRWVEYNGEIHILGSNKVKARKKMHISLSDSYFDTDEYTLVYNKYNDLNYPFRNGIALVVPPIINGSGMVRYQDYEIASYLQIPTAIHYMGTLESNPSDGNYRKRYRKIQHTYLSSIYNLDKKNFNIIDENYGEAQQ